MKVLVVLVSLVAVSSCGIIHQEVDHGQATSYQNFKIEHFHAVPTYIKKEDKRFLEHPVLTGHSSSNLKLHHGGKHDHGYAIADTHFNVQHHGGYGLGGHESVHSLERHEELLGYTGGAEESLNQHQALSEHQALAQHQALSEHQALAQHQALSEHQALAQHQALVEHQALAVPQTVLVQEHQTSDAYHALSDHQASSEDEAAYTAHEKHEEISQGNGAYADASVGHYQVSEGESHEQGSPQIYGSPSGAAHYH